MDQAPNTKRQTTIKLPEKALFLITKKARYKVLQGGRGSAKSWSMGIAAVVVALQSKKRILCTRQLQKSIKDSIHKLLADCIHSLGFDAYFTITQNEIRCYNGSEFIFAGVQNNVTEIKSMEGIDICICEEAQTMSAESWEILIPTIRKEGSEFWIAFNPDSLQDPTYQKFVVNPPDDCITVQMNYTDNPFFPDVLRQEMEYCKRTDYVKYQHIWEGKPTAHTQALVFKDKFTVQDFDIPKKSEVERFFVGCDWGFSCLGEDTLIRTANGEKNIKEIKVGEYVLTRAGFKKVLANTNTGIKKVYRIEIDCGYKNSIIATADHRIYTGRGWTQVKHLKKEELLCLIKLSLKERLTNAIRRASTLIISTIKRGLSNEYFTAIYMSFIKGLFQKVMLYTIKTGTRLITLLKTLFALLQANTARCIFQKNWGHFLWKNLKKYVPSMDIPARTGKSGELKDLQQRNNDAESVKNVEKSLCLLTYIKNTVAHVAGKNPTPAIVKGSTYAKCAVKNLWRHLMCSAKVVHANARISCQPLGEREVYDLTVEGTHEFFANGILVHNCDPTTIILSYIKDNILYICREGYGIGVDLAMIPQKIFASVPEAADGWPIYCDNARPETISFLRARRWRLPLAGKVREVTYNLKPADKWKGSVEDGIAYLKSFEKIVIHPSCKHTIEEFSNYSYETDKRTGEVLPKVRDSFNHCIDGLRYSLNGYITNHNLDWLRAFNRDRY